MRQTIFNAIFIIFVMLPGPMLMAYNDIYNINGDKVFNGDTLFELYSDVQLNNSYTGNNVNSDRFMRDFQSQVKFFETIDSKEYVFTMGRIGPLFFDNLTLNKQRFRYGSPGNLGWFYNRNEAWGKWWDQRGFRMDMNWGKNHLTGALIKTADAGTVDNAGGGIERWCQIDKDRYLMALRSQVELFDTQIGFSFVNQHFSDVAGGLTKIKEYSQMASPGPLSGTIANNPPTVIYIKFEDDSPEDNRSGSAIYRITLYINDSPCLDYRGAIGIAAAIAGGAPAGSDYGSHLEANGSQSVIVPIDISAFSPSSIKKIRIDMDVANDYKISIDADHNPYIYHEYRIITSAPGNVKDYGNRRIVTYNYGESSGDSILGVDLKGSVLSVPYKISYARNFKNYRLPTTNGNWTTESADALTIEASKDVGAFSFVGKFFYIDYNYDAGFAVDDNDDNDDKPDCADDSISFINDYDKDQNGQPDYKQDFLLFDQDRPLFNEYLDLNGNMTYDAIENDLKPDYPSEAGLVATRLEMGWKPFAGMNIINCYIYQHKEITGTACSRIHNKIKFDKTFSKFGKLSFWTLTERVWDNIQNDLDNYGTGITGTAVRDGREISSEYKLSLVSVNMDPMLRRNSFVNTSVFNFEPRIGDLLFVARYGILSDLNLMSDEEYQHGIVDNSIDQITYTLETVFKVSYQNFRPFKGLGFYNFNLIPCYKMERRKKFLDSTYPGTGSIYQPYDERLDVILMKGIMNLSDKTKLFLGYQISSHDDYLFIADRSLNQNYENPYYKQVAAVELTHSDNYWNRPIYLSVGAKYELKNDRITSDKQERNYFYVKSWFIW